MITTKRFDEAVSKLYDAFHDGTLNAFDCTACAVGNIVGNSNWVGVTYKFINQINGCIPNDITDIDILNVENTGYSAIELRSVERIFMFGNCNGKTYFFRKAEDSNKEIQFKGLCAVVEYLCELDNIPNVMDYAKLFETENEQPKYQLA